MKVWIVSIFLLALAGIAVYVVCGVMFSGMASRSPYDIPSGRYDYDMISMNFNRSVHFPEPRSTSGAMPQPPRADYVAKEDYLGRTFSVGVYHKDKEFARQVAQKAMRRIEKLALMADPAIEESELSRINRDAAGRKPVQLSEDMYALLKRSMEISEKSNGAFDLTAGPLRRLYAAYLAREMTPPIDEITEARAVVGRKLVELSEAGGKHFIHFTKPGVTLDLRDVIGGFCLDQAVYALRAETITSGYANVGDCWRLMTPPSWAESNVPWIMGIPSPRPEQAGKASSTFSFDPAHNPDIGAVVSKGYYSFYRFVGNSAVTDIVDPRSGACAGGVSVCTVVGPDALTCDAMAAVAVVLGPGEVDFFFKSFNPKEEEVKAKKSTEE